uniref:M28 family peptidase n=1 Tax=Staphylothermus marinus TaxID=2280 RepID=A0A7C4D8A3_STAMA
MINRLYEEFSKKTSIIEAADVLKLITRYNRIQGSRDLWNVVYELKNIVEDRGFDTRIIRIEPGVKQSYIETPISWNPIKAWIEFKIGDRLIAYLDLLNHPTLLAGHSPGGEGCSELSICDKPNCRNGAILATGYLYDLYLNTDADLIVNYSEDRYIDAVPYYSLFLEPSDPRNKVVMNIPNRLAIRLRNLINKGEKINVCWKADVEYSNDGLPVLIACRGDSPGPLYVSHICHPKPGAHDNASGSAANFIVLSTLSRLSSEFVFNSCHAWVPEYTGTIALYDKLPWKPISVVNLDMVGSKQYITGSTLVVVNPPRFYENIVSSTLWVSICKVYDTVKSFNNIPEPSIKYSISPYTTGSDHDVFITWGINSSMLNEWPSKFYHTDMDELHTLDYNSIVQISIASLISGYLLTKSESKLEIYSKLYESIVRNWYLTQVLKTDYSLNYLNKYLIKKPLISKHTVDKLMDSPLSSRIIYRILGREKYFKLSREYSNAFAYLEVYAPLAEKLDIKEHVKHYKAELLIKWKKSDEKYIVETWNVIKSSLNL